MACRCSTTAPPIQSRYGSLSSFALWPAFPASDYYEDSAPQGISRARAFRDRVTTTQWGSHGHVAPFDGGSAQLYPCRSRGATSQRQHRRRLSPTDRVQRNRDTLLPASSPYPSDLSRHATEGASDTGSQT